MIKDYPWLTLTEGVYKVTTAVFASFVYKELTAILETYPDIVIDLKDTVVRNEFIIKVAEWREKGYTILLADTVNELVDAYIQTGYFVKERLGLTYKDWLINLIETSGYPLMIKDNRLTHGVTSLHIIQFLDTSTKRLRYRELIPFATNPNNLKLALGEYRELWVLNTIFDTELNERESGYRFACTLEERTILDILTGIFNKDKKLMEL